MKYTKEPALLILNQMAGPMTWELAEDLGKALGAVALLTGHPDTLTKQDEHVQMYAAIPYYRGSFARRALSWLQYWLQAFCWLWRWPKATPMLLFSNPPILVWLGWLMYHLRGQRYAIMVHDVYPDVLVRMGTFPEKHWLMSSWRWLNRHAYEHAELVMTLGEYMAATLAQQFNSACTKAGQIEVIPPWVDIDVIKPIPKAENWFAQKYNQVDKLTVMYSGNMGIGHDIETMLEAARQLRHCDEIHFMFIGAGPKWKLVEEAVKNESLLNITLLGWQPEEVIPYSLASADVALVSLEPGFEGVMVPSKGGYAMAAGSNLLLLSNGQNELRLWIERYELGAVVEPGDSQKVTNYLLSLYGYPEKVNDHRKYVYQIAQRKFSREISTATFLLHICSLIKSGKEEVTPQSISNKEKN
jgi:glycosyltransferase involved in cell wall biosynthesis